MQEEIPTATSGIRERLMGMCDTLDGRMRGLLDTRRRVSDDVHEIRKLGKALRGGLVLADMPRESVRAVTAVGRMLAGQRDAVSRMKTWKRLGWDDSPHAADPAVQAVDALLEKLARSAGRRPPEEAVAWAQARIAGVRQALAESTEIDLQAKLPGGVAHLRQLVRKRMKHLSMKSRDAPAFHELRKALKAWLGAQVLLGLPPDGQCLALAELLGDENDLSALESWLNAHGFTNDLAPVVWSLVSDRHHTLRAIIVAERDAAMTC